MQMCCDIFMSDPRNQRAGNRKNELCEHNYNSARKFQDEAFRKKIKCTHLKAKELSMSITG